MCNDYNWDDILSSDDIDEVWSAFVHKINNFLDLSVPTISYKSNPFLRNSKIRTLLRRKRRHWKQYTLNPSPVNLLHFIRSSDSLDSQVRACNSYKENKIINSYRTNSKTFWSYVSSKLRSNRKLTSITDQFSSTLNNDIDIASAFNKFFTNVFDTTSPLLLPMPPVDISSDDLFLPSDIKKVMPSLKLTFSADMDNLSYGIFKLGGDDLLHILLQIINKSLLKQVIPLSWKIATVYPVYKSGNRQIMSNYRPISVTSVASRIMERLIRNRIMVLLNDSNFFGDSQYGFRPNRSSEIALLVYNDYLTKTLDSGATIDTIYLDLSKAFERVPHCHLLNKILKVGLPLHVTTWINNFFTNRLQKVSVNGVCSDLSAVRSGVIQGSVLGPLCFLIYTNDVDNVISNSLLLKYADDIKISLASHRDLASQLNRHNYLQEDLSALHDWSVANHMKFNIQKTTALHLGASNIKSTYTLGIDAIVPSSTEKDLGILFESPLSFNQHISTIVKKANSRLGIILKIFKLKDPLNALTLYKSYVRSILEFSSIVWSPFTQSNINKIEVIQKRFCNSIPRLRSLKYQEQLNTLRIYSLKARRLRYQLIFLFKLIHGLVDLKLDDFFQYSNTSNTRSHNLSFVPKCSRNNYRRYFFAVDVINYWNDLSDSEVNVASINQFKSSIDTFFKRKGIW